MQIQPLVSVLMTSYNRQKYIAEAIESVLASTYKNFELVIVDDDSKDNTVAVARSYEQKDDRVKVFENEKNLGDYHNRNKAASYASGKYVKYLDSDDFMYPHCLQVMVTAMEQFPDAGYGLSGVYDSKKPFPICLSPHDAYIEHFYSFGHFNRAPGSAIILKKAFDEAGGFTGNRMIGDNELWFKLSMYYSLVKFPRDLIWTRLHEGQESQSDYAKLYEQLSKKVIKEALAHKDCPLKAEEISAVKKHIARKKIKKMVINLLNK